MIAFNYSAGHVIWFLAFFVRLMGLIAEKEDHRKELERREMKETRNKEEEGMKTEVNSEGKEGERNTRGSKATKKTAVAYLFLAGSSCVGLFWFCILLIGFRHHLFVWSVFAPKFFYLAYCTVLLELFGFVFISATYFC
jgi:hypothetical protein